MNGDEIAKGEDSHETLDVLYEISEILNCGLDKQGLAIAVALCECGVNPEALAMVIKELKRETLALHAEEQRMKD